MTSAGLARMGLARMPKNAPGWFFGHLLAGAGGLDRSPGAGSR